MTECPACADASEHPLGCWYRLTDCQECAARWLARSPTYADAAAAGAITPRYKDALIARFCDDWRAGHERVKAWAKSAGDGQGDRRAGEGNGCARAR